MKRKPDELVAEIRTLYGHRNQDKFQMQADMVELRDTHGWTHQQITDKTGVPQPTISRWLKAWDEQVSAGNMQLHKLTPAEAKARNYGAVMRRALIDTPELVTTLSPAEQRKVAAALDTASAKRQHERKQAAKAKEREHLGDETVEDLALKEELQSTEYLLIKARGNIRGFVQHTRELGSDTPESWRSSCLEWIEDLAGHLGMAKALLVGDDIDWTAFEEMLAKEGN